MPRSFRLIWVFGGAAGAIALLLLADPVWARAAEIIRGRVVNGTFDNRPVAGQPVQLFRMRNESATTIASAQTGPGGEFAFRVADTGGTYLVVARYGGVEYTSQPVRANAGATIAADIVVYELTAERPAISFPYRIVFIDRLGVGVISVREIVEIANPSPRTYLGAGATPDARAAFGLAIPKGAEGVTPFRGMTAPVLQQGRLMETSPLQPGVQDVAFGYQVRYWGTKTTLRWTLEENTGSMDVAAPDQGVRLASPVLEPKPPGDLRGQRFLRIGARNLARGQIIEVTLTGLPADYAPLARWLAVVLAVGLTTTMVLSVRSSRQRPVIHRQAG